MYTCLCVREIERGRGGREIEILSELTKVFQGSNMETTNMPFPFTSECREKRADYCYCGMEMWNTGF